MQGNIQVPPHATLSSCVYNISIAAAAIAVAAVVLRLQQKGCTVNSIRFRKWQQNKKKKKKQETTRNIHEMRLNHRLLYEIGNVD